MAARLEHQTTDLDALGPFLSADACSEDTVSWISSGIM